MVLLKIYKDGSQYYQDLDYSFHVIQKRIVTKDKWEDIVKHFELHQDVFAIIMHNNGSDAENLFPNETHFLMNENGTIFKEITPIQDSKGYDY